MGVVKPTQYKKVAGKKFRETVKKLNYKLSKDTLADLQTTYGNMTSVRAIFDKVRALDEANDSFYTTRVASGKITMTSASAADLGVTDIKLKEASGFMTGSKTTRVSTRKITNPKV